MTRKFNFKAALVVLFAVSAVLTGCTAECYDKYDCMANAKRADDKDGGVGVLPQLTCVNNKCVTGDPGLCADGTVPVDGGC